MDVPALQQKLSCSKMLCLLILLTNVPPLMRSKVVILCVQTMVHAGHNSHLEFSDVAHDVFRLIYVSPFEIVS
jgi:hypothetical protein